MKRVLPAIVISQFFCTSLWFAGNAVMPDIAAQLHLTGSYLAYLTSAVQLGFITGTLLFALLTIADRFAPATVFLCSAIIAALFNLTIGLTVPGISLLLCMRFFTGFFLAGIYPVGMKIAADHYEQGLGKSLGFLVGALVLGTAFPHLLKSLMAQLPWRYVIFCTSLLSVFGGVCMFLLVPNGPYRKPAQQLNAGAFMQNFKNANFRAAALGYFGHMWELYAFWVFVPLMLGAYSARYPSCGFNIPLLSFLIIVSGSLACVISGYISQHTGPKKVAVVALSVSGACCLLSPLLLFVSYTPAFLLFMFIWSLSVIADSPMFSTLVAQNALPSLKGTALTIVNCLGFFITIISIQLVSWLHNSQNPAWQYMLLVIGPALGLLALAAPKAKA